MEILYEVKGDHLTIFLPKELDHHNAKTVIQQSDWYIVSNCIKNITFDFKDTEFMDSSGVGVIMGRYKLIRGRGGKIFGVHIGRSIDRILTISGLYKLVNKKETTGQTNW